MSNNVRRKVYLTFPATKTKEAIICDMYDQYKIRFNIRNSSVTQEVGIIALELEGPEDKMNEALKYFESRGVLVEPVEMDVMAG